MMKGPPMLRILPLQVFGHVDAEKQCLFKQCNSFEEKASSAIVEPSFSSDDVISVRSVLEITFICYLCIFIILSIAFAFPLWMIHEQQRKNNKDASSRINATQKTNQNSQENKIQKGNNRKEPQEQEQ